MSISPASRSNVQYNPAGDTKNKIKTSSLDIGFLGAAPENSFCCPNRPEPFFAQIVLMRLGR
jgi:hypothetical protein